MSLRILSRTWNINSEIIIISQLKQWEMRMSKDNHSLPRRKKMKVDSVLNSTHESLSGEISTLMLPWKTIRTKTEYITSYPDFSWTAAVAESSKNWANLITLILILLKLKTSQLDWIKLLGSSGSLSLKIPKSMKLLWALKKLKGLDIFIINHRQILRQDQVKVRSFSSDRHLAKRSTKKQVRAIWRLHRS